ncbi:MAG TPA: GNAT family N-acetyltransferase [Thermohalobaculum sp.]|nr:GNAT family N-acetyltransferase [Thermohalobaculum sp.]
MKDRRIRRALPRDAQALARCIKAAYAAHAARIPDLPPVSDGIALEIADNLVWVAEQSGEILGGAVMAIRPGHAVLVNLAVVPAATGTGLGRALAETCEAEARRQGIARMKLTTHVDIPENLSLYRHLGWRESHRAGNRVHMVKDLGE